LGALALTVIKAEMIVFKHQTDISDIKKRTELLQSFMASSEGCGAFSSNWSWTSL